MDAIVTLGFFLLLALAWYFWPSVTDGPNW
jgi:hypothetical protein